MRCMPPSSCASACGQDNKHNVIRIAPPAPPRRQSAQKCAVEPIQPAYRQHNFRTNSTESEHRQRLAMLMRMGGGLPVQASSELS